MEMIFDCFDAHFTSQGGKKLGQTGLLLLDARISIAVGRALRCLLMSTNSQEGTLRSWTEDIRLRAVKQDYANNVIDLTPMEASTPLRVQHAWKGRQTTDPERMQRHLSGVLGASSVAAMNTAEFRKQQANITTRPYEVLFPPQDGWSIDTLSKADAVLKGRWEFGRFPSVDIRSSVRWDEICAADRNWHFHLHSWTALGPVLAAYERTGNISYIEFAVAVAQDWACQYPTLETPSPFAWYDMAVGARSYRLGYILDRAARAEEISDEGIDTLVASALLHAECLADDTRFASHSNHGFYFAAGQLALARRLPSLPGMADSQEQANARLEALLQTQFTNEGVHREHSPEYHLMVLEVFQGLINANLLVDDKYLMLSNRIHEALAWFILPNGRLAMFGDTSYRLATPVERCSSDNLQVPTSPEIEATPLGVPMRAFPESGYAVVRGDVPPGERGGEVSSYLAQTCAFHSRVHKHADDLSFVWFDRGHELLIDPGKYGYVGRTDPGSELAQEGFWYSDPNRIYVESTKAHNTVEIDGRSYPRRGVEPYGSALRRWGQHDGVSYVESKTTNRDQIHHERVLLFLPGHWLVVFDRLVDDRKEPHEFVQRFHFAPELALFAGEDQLQLILPGPNENLHMVSLLASDFVKPISGERSPSLLGWISRVDRVMEPCWTAGFATKGVSQATFATLFTFGSDSIVTSGLATATSKVDANGRKALLRWKQGSRIRTVRFARPEPGEFALSYRDVASKDKGSQVLV